MHVKPRLDHPAYEAITRARGRSLAALGFDRSVNLGFLASYMEMLNQGGSGGYTASQVNAARVNFGKDPLPFKRRKI